MGIPLKRFAHYTFNAGENEGEPTTFLTQSELSNSRNVLIRSKGISTRRGSLIQNIDGSGIPNPFDPNPTKVGTNSIFGFNYAGVNYLDLFMAGDSIYKDSGNPTVLTGGLEIGLKWQADAVADILYMANGSNFARYFQPARSDTETYTVGYNTPDDFTATPQAGGSIPDGTYQYFVTLYDQLTITESNRQLLPISATLGGGNNQVLLAALPLDPENRSTHWRIYRQDDLGYYPYDLIQIPYDSGTPQYLDNIAVTGNLRIAPNDNDRPDVLKTLCSHGKIMVYAGDNLVEWSKPYQRQNVPTYNREVLDDDSFEIVKVVTFKTYIVAFKTESIYVLSGDFNLGTVDVNRCSKTVGTKSPDSVQVGPEGIYFFGSDGKPRLLTPTDFFLEDLRDSTDISFKYRDKFENLNEIQYPNIFSVLFDYKQYAQYRLYVPVGVSGNYCNECYVYDYGLAKRNQTGESAWFDLKYNINLKCATISKIPSATRRVHAGDDWSLLWSLDEPNIYFDGDEFFRPEGDGTVTYGAKTVTISSANMVVNQFRGMQLILYDRFTVNEIFRSKIVSNTSTTFTVDDVIPTLPTSDPGITVGGYVTLFATANYTHDHAGEVRVFKASVLLDHELGSGEVYFFINFDFYTPINYIYDYINNPANPSLSPKTDTYLIIGGTVVPFYDSAHYDQDSYSGSIYETEEFVLNNKFPAEHVSWGLVTREPSRPFTYIGSSIFYQYKATMQKGAPSVG